MREIFQASFCFEKTIKEKKRWVKQGRNVT